LLCPSPFARALDVSEPALRTLKLFVGGHMKLLAFDLGRRSFARDKIKSIWREDGLAGLWKIARAALGGTDAMTAAHFRALGELPEATLGRALFGYFRVNGFPIPGEKYGPPDNMLFHTGLRVLHPPAGQRVADGRRQVEQRHLVPLLRHGQVGGPDGHQAASPTCSLRHETRRSTR
jgi:hypothetical protein